MNLTKTKHINNRLQSTQIGMFQGHCHETLKFKLATHIKTH